MIRYRIRLIASLLAISAAAFVFPACNKDCPVCPKPEPVSDYDIYISGTYGRAVYVYNTNSKTITDSIPLQDSLVIYDMAVTGDGKYLLIIRRHMYTGDTGGLLVFDVQTHDTLPINADYIKNVGLATIEVSHSGRYIAIFDTESLTFIDGTSLEILYSDTLRVHNGRFLPDDSRFYFSRSGASQGFIDLTNNYACSLFQFTDDYGRSPEVVNLQPALDGASLYLFVRYGTYSNWLVSYRPAIDSIRSQWFIGPPLGDLRVSPDGKIILASDPGSINEEIPGSDMVLAVDPLNDGVNYISPGYCVTDSGLWYILAGDLAITPDSRYVGIADERGQGFALMDLKTQRYVDVQYRRKVGAMFDLIACQKRRK